LTVVVIVVVLCFMSLIVAIYVTMGGMETDKVDGSSYISGTVEKVRYTSQFDSNNNYDS